jgi:hypothetical protein
MESGEMGSDEKHVSFHIENKKYVTILEIVAHQQYNRNIQEITKAGTCMSPALQQAFMKDV